MLFSFLTVVHHFVVPYALIDDIFYINRYMYYIYVYTIYLYLYINISLNLYTKIKIVEPTLNRIRSK